jgi:hypothetical protein
VIVKVIVTLLKAPWPAGAAVGDVVELREALPAWAVGKCVAAGPDAVVTRVAAAPAPAVDPAHAADALAQADAQAAEELAAQAARKGRRA